jgi:hypothetical protein
MDPGPAEGLASASTAGELFTWMQDRVDALLVNPGLQEESLSGGYAEHHALARQNRTLLEKFVADSGLCAAPTDTHSENGGDTWVA